MVPYRTGSQSAQSPGPSHPLPQPSFRKIEGEDVNDPAGVSDPTTRAYGYNDFSFFTRPDHYIRYIEPIESELMHQVEYDMDEQDQEWLDLVNEDRRKSQVGAISPEIFEILMDRLEKEWFELMKRVPKQDVGLPSEDSTCAICDDGEGENSNAIVFCDGCNLAVHQDCYGVPYIPEGQWLCRKCTVSPEVPVPCVFCPNEGGAFKQTSSGQWAHLLCAMFIPEVTVGNMLWMEPIDNIEKVPKSRWKLTCSLCKIKHGACIQCDKNICFAAFHVTCARRAKLLMGMKGLTGEDASYKGYCEKHLPEDVKKNRGEMGDVFEASFAVDDRTSKTSKSARAYSKKYSLGPPLVPQLIADKLETYYKKHFRNKSQFIQLVCKYWSLKREARRGAPLLKRLHLEPWTASTVSKQQSDREKALKLQYLINLRADLEKVRVLAELMRKREQHKLQQAQVLDDVISKVLFPHNSALRHAFEQIQAHDKNELFHRPVTRSEAPDYFDIVKTPMSFMSIEAKLDRGEYIDVESFKSDINLVFDNAMLYNKRDTVFHKTASRLKASAAHTMTNLDSLVPPKPNRDPPDPISDFVHIGDLEADTEILNLLLSEDSVKDDTNLIIETEPITSLFRIEREKTKPLPPRQAKPKKERPKRNYKLERERRKQLQASLAADSALILDASPGFRAPRATRSTRAALAALEAELEAESRQTSQTMDAESLAKNVNLPGGEPQDAIQVAGEFHRPDLSRKPRSWRREHLLLPGQGGPNMVESMDDQGSFKNFDRGWILPSGSRRHGRAVPDPPARELQHPRRGVGAGPSRQTGLIPDESVEDHTKPRLSGDADGPVVNAEEEDRPRIQEDSQTAPRKVVQKRTRNPPQASGTQKTKAPGPQQGFITLKDGEMVAGGTLVWAKMDSYPWWAAVVWEEDDSGVPYNVLKSKGSIPRTEPGPLTLVQFYDKARSWQWLELSSLRLLGEDKELDMMLTSGRGKIQIFRTARLRQGCRGAYRQAIAEMEGPEVVANEGSTGSIEASTTADLGAPSSLQIEQSQPQQSPQQPPRTTIDQPSSSTHVPPPECQPNPTGVVPAAAEKQESMEFYGPSKLSSPSGIQIREIVRPPSPMSSELSALESEV